MKKSFIIGLLLGMSATSYAGIWTFDPTKAVEVSGAEYDFEGRYNDHNEDDDVHLNAASVKMKLKKNDVVVASVSAYLKCFNGNDLSTEKTMLRSGKKRFVKIEEDGEYYFV